MLSKGETLPANNLSTKITNHHKNLLKDNKQYIRIIEKTYNHYYQTVTNLQTKVVEEAFTRKYGQPFHIMKADDCIIKKDKETINLNQNPEKDFIVIVFTVKGIIVISRSNVMPTKWDMIKTFEEVNDKTYKIITDDHQIIFIDENVHAIIGQLHKPFTE